jgi:disulfide bond formation protein DsbB
MSPSVSRAVNVVFVLCVCGVLLGAFAVQFGLRELPCPLCLLQRLALLGVGLGAMLNVVYGTRPRNYGISLLSTMFGGAVAVRHILLHILPDSPVHGFEFWGMHLYTLSLVSFAIIGLLLALMLFLDSQFAARYWATGETDGYGKISGGSPAADSTPATQRANGLGIFARLVLGLFICIAVANLVCTVLLCGLGPCPSDPTQYLLLSWLR